MKPNTSMKIATKLPVFLIGFCVVIAAVLTTTSYYSFRSAAINATKGRFEVLLENRSQLIESRIEDLKSDLVVVANMPSTRLAIERFSAGWAALTGDPRNVLQTAYIADNQNPAGQKYLLDRAAGGALYHIVHGDFHPSFRALQQEKGYYDIFLFDLSGHLIYSLLKQADFATDVLDGPYDTSGLADAYRATIDAPDGTVHFTDFRSHAPSNGAPASFVSKLVRGADGTPIGVLAFQLSVAEINAIATNPTGLKETGQVYLVARDGTARSRSSVPGGHDMLETLPDTPQIEAAAAGHAAFFPNTTGLQGVPVIADTQPLSFRGIDWNIVVEKNLAEILQPVQAMRNKLAGISLALTAIMCLLGWAVARSFTGPITRLNAAMIDVGQGDYDSPVADAARRDEIGEIGKTLVEVKSALKTARQAEADRTRQQDEQDAVVEMLSMGLVQLSQGDLSHPIEQPFPDGHDTLRLDFNRTLATLKQVISDLMETANSIRSGSVEISQASDDLSKRTENQAATLEQTAAALDELTASVKSAAEGAKSVETIVSEARDQAEESGGIVKNAVSAMTEIETSSKHISQIIGVIDDIAFQTNLLALNAGVEAARAGDAGRGFAVVASEVRALAQRSSEAAKEIKALISGSTKQVERGVDLVGKAGGALSSIVDRVAHISELISDIANGAAEQSIGLEEINIGVSQLDQVTQQNAAMVQEATAASHMLNSDATRLSDLVTRFTIDDTGQTQTPRPRQTGPQPVAPNTGQPAESTPQPTSGAAPRPAATASEPSGANVVDLPAAAQQARPQPAAPQTAAASAGLQTAPSAPDPQIGVWQEF